MGGYVNLISKLVKSYGITPDSKQDIINPGMGDYMHLTWNKRKFDKNLNSLMDNMFGDVSKADSMYQRINHKEYQFYNTTGSDFRSASDLQSVTTKEDNNADSSKINQLDVMEIKYMKEVSNRVKSARKEIKPEKSRGKMRIFDKLFNKNKPKAYIEVQKMTNLIKNLDLEQFDNQVFQEAFNVVSHPESLKRRKKGLIDMLDMQARKTDRVKKTILNSNQTKTSRNR